MAWQLIYTSAPRLLEAGRTGFGTVARHRAVSGMLASTVERFSQFARLPGYDPRRVVYTYRTVTVGSSIFHVFSCLRDAGSDYSGRTNHLAHHLIAEAREIRALAGTGLTAADVLLGMAWLSTWNEPPRFLDPAEEVSLSRFAPASTQAWAALTGHPGSARLLSTPAALKGTYLILPPGIGTLELFRESLAQAPQSGWQTSFTTCLDPNDEVGDFRWIGIPASSPLRAQAETSSRPVLDLTQPAQLPVPSAAPEPEPQAASASEASFAPTSELPSPGKVTLRGEMPPPKSAPALAAAIPTSAAAAPADAAPAGSSSMSTMGGWDTQPRKKATSKKGSKLPLIVGALVLIVGGAGFALWKVSSGAKAQAAFEQQLGQTWDKWVAPGQLRHSRAKIAGQKNLAEGQGMLDAHRQYLEHLHAAINKPGSAQDFDLPQDREDELMDLQEAFSSWQKSDAGLKKDWQAWLSASESQSLDSLLEKAQAWQQQRSKEWEKLTSSLRALRPPTPDAILLLKPLKQRVTTFPSDLKEMLALEKLNALFGPDLELTRWLKLSSALGDSNRNSRAQAVADVIADESLPTWLRDKAQEIQRQLAATAPKTEPMAETGGSKPNAEAPAPAKTAQKQDADSVEASTPLFLCVMKSGEDPLTQLEKLVLPVDAEMQIYIGAAADKHPAPGTPAEAQPGSLKQWKKIPVGDGGELSFGESIMAAAALNLKLTAKGHITQLPATSTLATQGLRIVARSRDGLTVLFDLRVLPASLKNTPIITEPLLKVGVTKNHKITLTRVGTLLARLHCVGQAEPRYLIRFEGAAADQKIYALEVPPGSATVNVVLEAPPPLAGIIVPKETLKDVEAEIKEVQKGLDKDNLDIKKNEESNSPKKVKDDNRKTYTDSRAKKELEMEQLQQKKKNLEAQPTLAPPRPTFSVPPGEYTLLEKTSGNTSICKLIISLQQE